MHRIAVLLAVLLAALSAALLLPFAAHAAGKFTLESAEVKPNVKIADKQVYKGFGCEGGNVSPSLAWSNAPAGTKSFAVTMYDPDAPTGSGWWHWVVFNLPADTTSLPAGAGNPGGKLPKGAVQSLQIGCDLLEIRVEAHALRKARHHTAHDGELADDVHQMIELADIDADGLGDAT